MTPRTFPSLAALVVGFTGMAAHAAPMDNPLEQAQATAELVRKSSPATDVPASATHGAASAAPDAFGTLRMPPTADGSSWWLDLPVGAARGQIARDGTRVFATTDPGVNLTTTTLTDGVQVATVTRNAAASTEITYRLGGDVIASLGDDGGVIIGRHETGGRAAGHDWRPVVTLGQLNAPWARDATGNAVATRYVLDDGAIVQQIDHRASTTNYPVVADPRVVFEPLPYVYLGKLETAVASTLEGAAAFCDILGNIPAVGPIAAGFCRSRVTKVAFEAQKQADAGKCVAYLFAPPLVISKGHTGDFCD
ncbi:MAG TPA: hypothetical protein VK519_02230 [Pinirhizobacter sp.]|uniref:hypothetical protein n=1 Tax=Pinirhizobacter sp. TaxID=2950432 RepID=UPI002C9F3779|nr:hypothetical protein [Pinirhizobacter sp.]HMH66714.1 hypothetical protein [Pinirhizobacter sp.]